jgi:hypothetical protein
MREAPSNPPQPPPEEQVMQGSGLTDSRLARGAESCLPLVAFAASVWLFSVMADLDTVSKPVRSGAVPPACDVPAPVADAAARCGAGFAAR